MSRPQVLSQIDNIVQRREIRIYSSPILNSSCSNLAGHPRPWCRWIFLENVAFPSTNVLNLIVGERIRLENVLLVLQIFKTYHHFLGFRRFINVFGLLCQTNSVSFSKHRKARGCRLWGSTVVVTSVVPDILHLKNRRIFVGSLDLLLCWTLLRESMRASEVPSVIITETETYFK